MASNDPARRLSRRGLLGASAVAATAYVPPAAYTWLACDGFPSRSSTWPSPQSIVQRVMVAASARLRSSVYGWPATAVAGPVAISEKAKKSNVPEA